MNIDNLSYEFDPKLDVGGVIGQNHEHVQRHPIQSAIMNAWHDGTRVDGTIYALPRKTANGNVTLVPVSLTEVLWRALESFCEWDNSDLKYIQQSPTASRLFSLSEIHVGNFDRFRKFCGHDFDQTVKKAVMSLIPGYWTPNQPQKSISA